MLFSCIYLFSLCGKAECTEKTGGVRDEEKRDRKTHLGKCCKQYRQTVRAAQQRVRNLSQTFSQMRTTKLSCLEGLFEIFTVKPLNSIVYENIM